MPVFGTSALAEACFGAAMAYIYHASNYNIAVPILAHALYNTAVTYFVWRQAVTEIQIRIEQEEKRLVRDQEGDKFNALCTAVFRILDVDNNGEIDPVELAVGQRLFGYTALSYTLSHHAY